MGCSASTPVGVAPDPSDTSYLGTWRSKAVASLTENKFDKSRETLIANVQAVLTEDPNNEHSFSFTKRPPFLDGPLPPDKEQLRKVHKPDMINWYKERVHRANEAGGPRCRLVWWKTIRSLGRLPRWPDDAAHILDAERLLNEWENECDNEGKVDGRAFCQSFFSHKWFNGNPDADGEKWSRLAHYGELGSCSVFPDDKFDYYYFIDYSGIEQPTGGTAEEKKASQARTDAGICMLPLYIACSVELIYYNTADYEKRAICRLERLLAYAYCFSPMIVYLDSSYPWHRRQPNAIDPKIDPNAIVESDNTVYKLSDDGKDVLIKMTDPVGTDAVFSEFNPEEEKQLITEVKAICEKATPLNIVLGAQPTTFEDYFTLSCKLDILHAEMDRRRLCTAAFEA